MIKSIANVNSALQCFRINTKQLGSDKTMFLLLLKSVVLYFLLSNKPVSGISCWVCENAKSAKECKETGYEKLCPVSETMCQIELRHGGWGLEPMIEKSCKRPSACDDNFVQNAHSAWAYSGEQIQCNKESPSSVCRCCCDTEMCNFDVDNCNKGENCPPLQAPVGGWMTCNGEFQPQTTCSFGCRREYGLVGPKVLYCDSYGNWSDQAPICQRVTCPPPMLTPKFGRMSCTNGIQWLSTCEFGCETGYRLHGGQKIQCVEEMHGGSAYGLWTRQQPECKPLQCPKLNVNHGSYICTNENYVGSTCTLQCVGQGEYQVYPKDFQRARCQRNEEWTATACCGLPCPPYAIMDFIVVLDSSSSVRAENWVKMKRFVRHFLSEFVVRHDSTQFGVIRYNAEVDTATQILLNSYPNSTAAVLEKFDQIPYDGRGTHTGQALKYVADVMLKEGNREIADDVVLLITDGASQDDVAAQAKRIRDQALFYVLPVKPPQGSLNMTEIELMAGEDQYVLRDAVVRGFDALDAEFSRKITSLLCKNPCKNPFHAHEQ